MDIRFDTMRFDCYYFDRNERIVNQFNIKVIGGQHTVRSAQFKFLLHGPREVEKEIELGIFETLDQAMTAIFYELWFMERENDIYHPDKNDLLSEPFERIIALIKGAHRHQTTISIYGCSKKYKYRRIEDKPNVDLPFFFDDAIPEELKRHLTKKPRKYKTVKLKFLGRNFQYK
jgi:hypothetical protein